MNDIQDRDLIRVRLRFLDLLKSFFHEEPDAEKLSRWRGIFSSLVQENITPEIDKSTTALSRLLDEMSLPELQDEYYKLFVNPFSETPLNMSSSYYLDGKNYGPSLVLFRQFLKDSELENKQSSLEEDDSLLLMLDFMATLVEEEKSAATSTKENQARLLIDFLHPSSRKMKEAVFSIANARFYQQCFTFLNGYLNLEKQLLDSE